MNAIASFGVLGIWIGVFSSILFALCLFFVLSYFQHLKYNDDQKMRQSKFLAVTALVLALLIPAFYQLFLFNQMM